MHKLEYKRLCNLPKIITLKYGNACLDFSLILHEDMYVIKDALSSMLVNPLAKNTHKTPHLKKCLTRGIIRSSKLMTQTNIYIIYITGSDIVPKMEL